MRKTGQLLLGVSAIALFATYDVRDARADCVGTPADGATIDCTGTDTDGLDATGFTGQTINAIRDDGVSPAVPAVVNGLIVDDGNTLNIDRYTEINADGTGATANGLEIGSNNAVGPYPPNSNQRVKITSTTGVGFKMGDTNTVFFSNYADVSGATYGIEGGSGNDVTFYSYWNLTGTTAAAIFADNNTIDFGFVELHADVGIIIGNNNRLDFNADGGTAIVTTGLVAGDNNTIYLNYSGGNISVGNGNVIEAGNGNTIYLARQYQALNGSLVVAGDDTTINDTGSDGTFGQYIFDVGDRATIVSSTYGTGTIGGIRAGDDLKLSFGGWMSSEGFGVQAGNNALIATQAGSKIVTDGHAIEVGNDLSLLHLGYIKTTDEAAISAGLNATITNYGTIVSDSEAIHAGDYLTLHSYGMIVSSIVGDSYADITIHEEGQIFMPDGDTAINVDDYSTVTVYGSIDDGYDPDDTLTDPITGEPMPVTGSRASGITGDDFNNVNFYGTMNVGGEGIKLDNDSHILIGEGAVLKTGGTAATVDDRGTIVNYGTIFSDGHGLKTKASSTVHNYGEIYTVGGEGLKLDSANVTAYNYGYISAGDEGVEGRANFYFENYGTVTAINDAVQATDNIHILNYGLLEATGINVDPGDDIAGDGIDMVYGIVDNYGTIRATGLDQAGVDFDPDDDAAHTTTINNYQGALIQGGYGIYVDYEDKSDDFSPKTINNWGSIIGLNGQAISLGIGDDTLVVHEGSRIAGLIDLGETAEYDDVLEQWVVVPNDTDNDTFKYAAGGPAVFQFANALPETIIATSTSYKTSGNSAIFSEVREAAAGDRATADMVQALGSTLAKHLQDLAGKPSSGAVASQPGWATVFGGRTDQDETGDISDYDYRFGGLVGGIDGMLSGNVRAGAFFGSTLGQLDIDVGEGKEVDTMHVFGGVYATTGLPQVGRLEVSVLGGAGFNESTRTLMTNMTATGAADLEADYTTGFVSPEVALTFGLDGSANPVFTARPSLRYVGLFTEDINETGDGVTWSTGSRTTHILEGRFALSGHTVLTDEKGLVTRLGATAGVIGYTMMGDDIDVAYSASTYSGTAAFAGTEPSQIGGFGAINLSTQISSTSILFGEIEGTVFEEDAYAMSGKAGLRMNY